MGRSLGSYPYFISGLLSLYSSLVLTSHEQNVRRALGLAVRMDSIDLPIAAVISDRSGTVISESRNRMVESGDFSQHAEIAALRGLRPEHLGMQARSLTLTVTLEPCPMCAWAIRSVGIGSVVFGAYNQQYGAAGSVFDLLRDRRFGPDVEVFGGVLAEDCSRVLGEAFSKMRNNNGR